MADSGKKPETKALSMKKYQIEDISKKQLKEIARKASQEAAAETMEIMGYNISWQDGKIIKKYKDGTTEKLKIS